LKTGNYESIYTLQQLQSQFARKAGVNIEAIKRNQFQEHYGQVLRFWAYWVDDALGGMTRKFVIHYYLVDDTIEITERFEPNSGFGSHSVFLNRGKLLKVSFSYAKGTNSHLI
jgi:hypothetical protein